MLAVGLKKYSVCFAFVAFSCAYVFICIWFLRDFFKWDIHLYLGLVLAPYISNVRYGKLSLRYLYPTLIALALAIFIPVKTLFFVAVIFSAVLMIENCIGKLSHAFLLLALLISPVFKYIISMIDFPIRLWLTDKVVDMLNFIGIIAKAEGNIIAMNKYEFAVDPACAGLNMLLVSLILCLFIIAYYQKNYGRSLSFAKISAFFALTICLNIFSNFFRILVLVLFKIMPGTFFHEFVGIACLVLYVVIPLLLGTKPILLLIGKPSAVAGDQKNAFTSTLRFPTLHVLVLSLIIFIGLNLMKADTLSIPNGEIQINGFKKQNLANGILKFENTNALIYLKPSPFYIPGHDPKICWTGSGYNFNNIRKEKIAGVDLYTALLTKGKDHIHAAWWFDDGQTRTIDEFRWRWISAKKTRKFYLVNVNTMSRLSLQKQITSLLGNSKPLFKTP